MRTRTLELRSNLNPLGASFIPGAKTHDIFNNDSWNRTPAPSVNRASLPQDAPSRGPHYSTSTPPTPTLSLQTLNTSGRLYRAPHACKTPSPLRQMVTLADDPPSPSTDTRETRMPRLKHFENAHCAEVWSDSASDSSWTEHSPLTMPDSTSAHSTPALTPALSSALPELSIAPACPIRSPRLKTLSEDPNGKTNPWYYAESRRPLIVRYNAPIPQGSDPRATPEPRPRDPVWLRAFYIGAQATMRQESLHVMYAERLVVSQEITHRKGWSGTDEMRDVCERFVRRSLELYKQEGTDPLPYFAMNVLKVFGRRGQFMAFKFSRILEAVATQSFILLWRDRMEQAKYLSPTETKNDIQAALNLSKFIGDLARLEVISFDAFVVALGELTSCLSLANQTLQGLRDLVIHSGEELWLKNRYRDPNARYPKAILDLCHKSLWMKKSESGYLNEYSWKAIDWFDQIEAFFRVVELLSA